MTAVAAPAYASTSEEFAAHDLLNKERQRRGFGLLAQNNALDVAAQGHANYLLRNSYAGHFQDNTKPYSTGNAPADD